MSSIKMVEKTFEDKGCIIYKATAAGGTTTVNLILEYNEKLHHSLSLCMHVTAPYKYWEYGSWVGRFWCRIKGSFWILVKGTIEYEEVFIFNGADQVTDFRLALREGTNKINESNKSEVKHERRREERRKN